MYHKARHADGLPRRQHNLLAATSVEVRVTAEESALVSRVFEEGGEEILVRGRGPYKIERLAALHQEIHHTRSTEVLVEECDGGCPRDQEVARLLVGEISGEHVVAMHLVQRHRLQRGWQRELRSLLQSGVAVEDVPVDISRISTQMRL